MTYKNRYCRAIAVLFTFTFATVVSFPAELFSSNQTGFTSGYFDLIVPLLSGAGAIVCISSFFLAFLPPSVFHLFTAMLCGLTVLVYLQGSFLFSNYGPFNGEEIRWGKFITQWWIDIFVWGIGGIIVAVFPAFVARKAQTISVFLLLVFSATTIVDLSKVPARLFYRQSPDRSDTLYQFSQTRNIIWIILDSFTSPAFDAVVGSEPNLLEGFPGFRQYPDVVSPFVTTWPTIPALMSGKEYDNSESLEEFTARALSEGSLPSLLRDSGYIVDLVTLPRFCPSLPGACYPTTSVVSRDVREVYRSERLELLDLTLFRVLPQPLKRAVYNDQRWFIQRLFDRIKNPKELYNAVSFPDVLARQAGVGTDRPVFKLFHLMIPHVPLRFDGECKENIPSEALLGKSRTARQRIQYEAQSKCAVRIASRIINTFSKLGIYNNSMIIVSADHGFPLRYLKYKATKQAPLPWIEYAWPLLMIKPFGTSHTVPFTRTTVPASLTDLPRTIVEEMGIASDIPGESLLRMPEGESRERRHRSYIWRTKYKLRDFLPPMREWKITGPVSDPASWHFVRALRPAPIRKKIWE